MKHYLMLLAAACIFSFAQGQQLNKAEYYFDTDPGKGNGTSLTVITGDSIMFSGPIPTSGLTNGFHFLCIRARNTNGVWSFSERRMFMIYSAPLLANVGAAEYYFDTDPGQGNGSALTVITGDSIVYSGPISTSGLQEGFHFLCIRTRATNGVWSLSERRMFFIKAVTPAANLSAAEYYFDSDPGVGNGTSMTVTGTDSILYTGPIPTGSLGEGFHFLCIRTRDANRNWSLAERRMFYVQSPYIAPPLVAAEYFINVDTGYGQCTSIPVTKGDSIDFNGTLAFSDTSQGVYYLYVRVKDSLNVWSESEIDTFLITTGVGIQPVSAIGNAVLFQNYPNPFMQSTSISYFLRKPGDVSFIISDVLEKPIQEFYFGKMSAGKHTFSVDRNLLSAGTYYYKMICGGFVDTKRMTIIR
jgi:hypothetical protein